MISSPTKKACFGSDNYSNDSKRPSVESILSDLGRPTRRGIRKCPRCGMVNGTRGLSCKNRVCDMVFKDVVMSSNASLNLSSNYKGWFRKMIIITPIFF